MSASILLLEKKDAVAIVTLNRPEAMNAFSAELRLALGQAFRDLQADPDIRVAIVTGAGRAFCAGMDLKELLPTCRALAVQMTNCVPHVLKGYKQLIDTGYGMHLPDALRYELAAGTESAKQVTSVTLAARRAGVMARGREQK